MRYFCNAYVKVDDDVYVKFRPLQKYLTQLLADEKEKLKKHPQTDFGAKFDHGTPGIPQKKAGRSDL